MLIDGIPSTTEDYRGITALDSHETCCISDHTWTWGYLLMATGDGIWGDHIERACFNAAFGAIKKDWKAHQYFSCPNQVLATPTSNHTVLQHGNGWMSYRPNGGHGVACCGGNVHRMFPNYVIRMWMSEPEGGLAAILYGPSRIKTTVGSGQAVEIEQQTNYPFEEEIHFVFQSQEPVAFPWLFRIPRWCSSPAFYLNGKPITLLSMRNGFATLNRRFNPGDRITLVLPMKSSLSHWPGNGVGVEHGPLVYSLPIKEEWTPSVEAKWSTPEFPEWSAMPAGPWNYGLAVDDDNLRSQLQAQRKPMSEDPWVDPPINVVVPGRKIKEWDVEDSKKNPNQKFTPPLPVVTRDSAAAETEQIALVPYGATQLRLTIFPQVKREYGSGE